LRLAARGTLSLFLKKKMQIPKNMLAANIPYLLVSKICAQLNGFGIAGRITNRMEIKWRTSLIQT
jgi:hypothetical protein